MNKTDFMQECLDFNAEKEEQEIEDNEDNIDNSIKLNHKCMECIYRLECPQQYYVTIVKCRFKQDEEAHRNNLILEHVS